jgi:hypothetical protein
VLVWNQVVGYTVSFIMIILLGLIPLCVGLIKYSTIVSSVIIISVRSSSGLGFDQLLSPISVVSAMGMIGVIGIVISIK